MHNIFVGYALSLWCVYGKVFSMSLGLAGPRIKGEIILSVPFFLDFSLFFLYNACRFPWAGAESVRLTPQDLAVFLTKMAATANFV